MPSLKRYVLGLAPSCCLLTIALGCHGMIGPSLQGSGVAKTEERTVESFSEIDVGAASNST